MIGDGGGKILWSELLERTSECAMTFKCSEGKTAEFAVFNEFNHIIDKRIISEVANLLCGQDKIALMSMGSHNLVVLISDLDKLS